MSFSFRNNGFFITLIFLNPNNNKFLYFIFFLKGTHCGGYNGGRSAMEHAAEGLFDNAIETTWTRGENTEVFWASGRDIHIECSKQFK